jgi:hypothetical protein
MTMKRGIILRPSFFKNSTTAEVDSALLKRLMLYWDIFEYPSINGMNPNYDSLKDLKFLKDAGVIEESFVIADESSAKVVDYKTYRSRRHTIKITKEDQWMKNAVWNAQVELCKQRNFKDKSTSWAIGDMNDELSSVYLNNKGRDSIFVEFINCLPVPGNKAGLSDILKFKEKRREELLHLRVNLDELSNSLSTSENLQTELKKGKEKLELSLLELHRVLDESKVQKVTSNLKVYLNLEKSEMANFIVSSLVVGQLTESGGLGLLASYGLNVLLKLGTKKVSSMDKVPDRLKDFLYVYDVEKELSD